MKLSDLKDKTFYSRWNGQRHYGQAQPVFVIDASSYYVAEYEDIYETQHVAVNVGGVQDLVERQVKVGVKTEYAKTRNSKSSRWEPTPGVLCLTLQGRMNEETNEYERVWARSLVPTREIHAEDPWALAARLEAEKVARAKAASERDRVIALAHQERSRVIARLKESGLITREIHNSSYDGSGSLTLTLEEIERLLDPR